MTRQRHPPRSPTDGFTLIEMLLIMAIMGVLAAIMIPSFLETRRRPYDTASQACHHTILVQLTEYRVGSQPVPPGPVTQFRDVARQCTTNGVQISSVAPTQPTAAGNAEVTATADGDLEFWVWHPQGRHIYYTNTQTGDQLTATPF
ncbi:type IV pilin protein [Deinococcus multiflagellatus]|uniref:type IV pilin protein n=1 Tax=Deinococcus multiflagellatus TaxID=1656887 RepID=UPI001CCB8F78|nr:type II secretion system protein [Deinococcus multiflagellatus]MBZ9714386.1 type II secretion system GspH family protein [Deinococcus multiflagellatus]